jgi:type II secretory pathway predicted ATPase ExeA
MAGVDVWAAHFGLTRTPFTKTVPANKLFDRAAHAEAVARIHYCINQAALGVVVGDTGAGKTVAVRAAVASLDRTKFTLVYLSNPSGGCRGMYVAIATALGATPRFHKAEAINQAAALLAAEEHERHRRVIFVIDEAHLLSPEQLEELRLLSNAELDSTSPFAGILLGQPTLATRLRQGIFAALDQRISVRYTIGGMDLAESIAYLRHHLAIALLTELRPKYHPVVGMSCGRVPAHVQRGETCTGSGDVGARICWSTEGDGRPVGAVPAS